MACIPWKNAAKPASGWVKPFDLRKPSKPSEKSSIFFCGACENYGVSCLCIGSREYESRRGLQKPCTTGGRSV